MSKPITTPDWVTDANAASETYVVEPNSDKRDVGWAGEEKPPAQFLNWLFYWICKWVAYLANLEDEALTWTADHVFEQDVEVQGNLVAGTLHHSDDDHVTLGAESMEEDGGWTNWYPSLGGIESTASDPAGAKVYLRLPTGRRIKHVRVRVQCSNGAATGRITAELFKVVDGAPTAESDVIATLASTAVQTLTLTGIGNPGGASNNPTVAAGDVWVVAIGTAGGAFTRNVYDIEVDFDWPL